MELEDAGRAGELRCEEEAYRHALALFLSGSDEKSRTHAYLDDVVRRMPARRVLLDVGPADGTTTSHLSPFFERTVCIEPSEPMRRALERVCPEALVLAEPVAEAEPGVSADLTLLSHDLYYVPREQWAPTVLRVLDWVEPGGTLSVVAYQPDAEAPPQEAVAEYVRRHFADPAGGFTMQHAQDVLRIRRPCR